MAVDCDGSGGASTCIAGCVSGAEVTLSHYYAVSKDDSSDVSVDRVTV